MEENDGKPTLVLAGHYPVMDEIASCCAARLAGGLRDVLVLAFRDAKCSVLESVLFLPVCPGGRLLR